MGSEIELKLAIDPIAIARLRHALASMAVKRRRDSGRHLVSTYFDTRSFSLAHNGLSLRIRRIGRRKIQTIKFAPPNSHSLITRSEWENPIKSDQPNLGLVDDPAPRRLIDKYRGRKRLDAMFVTDVTRETWLLRLAGSEVECAIDRGRIAAPGRQVPICEAELELKRGTRAPLIRLARKLNKVARLHVETRSKAARGYDLVTGAAPSAPSIEFAVLDRAMGIQSAFALIARGCAAHVLACARHARQNADPEGIHQLRIAIRRLRAAFSIFRKCTAERHPAIVGKLRSLQQELGAAREWDVLIQDTISTMPDRLRGQEGFADLINSAEATRTKEHKRAWDALEDPRCTDLLLELISWIDRRFGLTADRSIVPQDADCRRIADFAVNLLKARERKVRKLAKKIHKLDPQELHELRIGIKKLRYAVEFFRDLWRGVRVGKYLSTLKHLQDSLGAAHDAIVASRLIASLEANQEHSDRKFMGVADWTTDCADRERKRTIHLLRKLRH